MLCLVYFGSIEAIIVKIKFQRITMLSFVITGSLLLKLIIFSISSEFLPTKSSHSELGQFDIPWRILFLQHQECQ